MRKYTNDEVTELLEFFERNFILLVNSEDIGDANLDGCLVNPDWIHEVLEQHDVLESGGK